MTDAEKPAVGRPSSYTDEMADLICDRIADGESLRSICAEDGMPRKATVFRWLAANPAFRDQYARAREAQADAIFDEIIDIADDGTNDWMERRGEEDAGWVANGEHIQRSRVRIDARKWMAGKLKPKVYGEKLEVKGPGENGEHLHKVSADDAFARIAGLVGGVAPRAESSTDGEG